MKRNILSKIDDDEPIFGVNKNVLRTEATKILSNLFDFSFDFSKIVFEKEVMKSSKAAKLSSTCTESISSQNRHYFKIKGGVVVDQKPVLILFILLNILILTLEQ